MMYKERIDKYGRVFRGGVFFGGIVHGGVLQGGILFIENRVQEEQTMWKVYELI